MGRRRVKRARTIFHSFEKAPPRATAVDENMERVQSDVDLDGGKEEDSGLTSLTQLSSDLRSPSKEGREDPDRREVES